MFYDFLKTSFFLLDKQRKMNFKILTTKFPLIKTIITVVPSVFLGDILSQQLNIKYTKIQNEFDKERLKRMCIIGLGMTPINHYIIYTLEKYFPGNATKTILKKMSFNIFFAPMLIALSFSSNVLLQQGRGKEDAIKKVKADVIPTFKMGFFFWPFVSFMNFKFTPLAYRPLVGSLAGILWNIFISNQANK
jgi:hypothetical protein